MHFVIYPMRAAYPTRLTLLDFNTLIIRDILWRVQIVQFLAIQYYTASSSTISRTSLQLHMTNQKYNYSKNLRPNLHSEGLLSLDYNNRLLLLISVLHQ